MAVTKFMTASEIVTEYLPQGNFDENLIDKEIEPAQRKYIRAAIGKDFYDDLIASFGSYTADEAELMTYLKRALARYVVFECLPMIRNNITSQGVMINDTEFSEQSSRQDFAALRSKVASDGDFECKEMVDWLCDEDQDGKFPLMKKGIKRQNKSDLVAAYK